MLGYGVIGVVNDVLTLGKGLRARKSFGSDMCPNCHASHAWCPRCDSRQLFGVLQASTVISCDDCGAEFAV